MSPASSVYSCLFSRVLVQHVSKFACSVVHIRTASEDVESRSLPHQSITNMEDLGLVPVFRNASLLPSAADLLYAVPRLARKASNFALFYLPDQLDNFFSMARNSGSVIADATTTTTTHNLTTMTATIPILQVPSAAPTALSSLDDQGFLSFVTSAFSLQRLSNFDSVFSYLASRWAISTFFIVCRKNADATEACSPLRRYRPSF